MNLQGGLFINKLIICCKSMIYLCLKSVFGAGKLETVVEQ